LADGAFTSDAVKGELAEQEEAARRLRQQLAAHESLRRQEIALPDDGWLTQELKNWTGLLTDDMLKAAAACDRLYARFVSRPSLAPGKRRGYRGCVFEFRPGKCFVHFWRIVRSGSSLA